MPALDRLLLCFIMKTHVNALLYLPDSQDVGIRLQKALTFARKALTIFRKALTIFQKSLTIFQKASLADVNLPKSLSYFVIFS